MKIAIITALCGDRDRIVTPTVVHSGVDYISFSDKDWSGTIWNQKPLLKFSLDNGWSNRRNAKIYKILPQLVAPNYDYYFWVDAACDVIEHPVSIIDKYLKDGDIAVFRHRERSCVYQEIAELKRLNIDHVDLLKSQEEFYRSTGYPDNNGLYELPVIAYRNNDNIMRMCMRWWEIICKYSSRDQISLPYVLWSLNMKPSIVPGIVNGGLFNNNIMTQTRNHG